MPGLTEFFLFGIAGAIFQKDPLGRSAKGAVGSRIALRVVDRIRKPLFDALDASARFERPTDIYTLADYASDILSLCNSMGEGWLLTAEMVELIRNGAPNIVCAQPFACLPNHVVGKAVIKELRRRYSQSNIVAVDYDPGASEVNQLNRIKLMISVAKANLAEERGEAPVYARAEREAATVELQDSFDVSTTQGCGVVLDVDAISRRVAEELAREDAACEADELAREGAAHEAGELAHEDAACEAYDGRKVGAGGSFDSQP